MKRFDYYDDEKLKKKDFQERILANLRVQASWTDKATKKKFMVEGLTVNIGKDSTLVNLETLPPVGSAVNLRVLENDKTLIVVPTEVIRVQRDPGKPLVALSVLENLKKWKRKVVTAAEEWVLRQWRLNYEEEYVK
jgi:L-arabinose isomerase